MDINKWNVEALPKELRREIENNTLKQITAGKSGAHVFLLEGTENRYLKIAPRKLKMSLDREVQILKWIEGKLPAPKVLLFTQEMDFEYLLMTEVKGIPSYDPSFRNDLPKLVGLLAKGLKMIHSIDIKNCPFNQRLSVKLKDAEYRMLNGLVDEDNFDKSRYGKKAVDLFEELLVTKPSDEDLVFTHGDYSLANIIIDNGDIGGFIDWGRAGISDRYQDLAIAARSLANKFDAKWVPLLFKEYGIENIDYSKLEFYKLLDEFF